MGNSAALLDVTLGDIEKPNIMLAQDAALILFFIAE